MIDLLKNWHNYSMLYERVNTLDSGKRFVGNRLQEVTEEYGIIKISPEELERIKIWGGLEGDPEFLGSGSKGIAYKFGNKVLKITSDGQEAMACILIAGDDHPNVYNVHIVGRRKSEDQKENLHNLPYVIIYEFLDYPTKAMADITGLMYYKIRKSNLYYNWKESYFKIAINLMEDFLNNIEQDNSILGGPVGRHKSIEPKINKIATAMGWDNLERALFKEFWTVVGGIYNSSLNSVEEAQEFAATIFKDMRLKYFHQLALGLSFLQQNGITFHDLKTTNVMEKNGQIAIIDIGKSNVAKQEDIPVI
jgi:serine/threonine protein kinase